MSRHSYDVFANMKSGVLAVFLVLNQCFFKSILATEPLKSYQNQDRSRPLALFPSSGVINTDGVAGGVTGADRVASLHAP